MLKADADKMTPEQLAEHREKMLLQAPNPKIFDTPKEVKEAFGGGDTGPKPIVVDHKGLVIRIDPIKLDEKGIKGLCKAVGVKKGKTQKETVAAIMKKVNKED